jgi:hypothetical protein
MGSILLTGHCFQFVSASFLKTAYGNVQRENKGFSITAAETRVKGECALKDL